MHTCNHPQGRQYGRPADNGAGREKGGIDEKTNPMVVGTGGLTLFPGTELLDEANAGAFDPLNEREMLEEVLLFVENLECDCSFITHHTIGGANLTGPGFLDRKEAIITALRDEIERGNFVRMARIRSMKTSL